MIKNKLSKSIKVSLYSMAMLLCHAAFIQDSCGASSLSMSSWGHASQSSTHSSRHKGYNETVTKQTVTENGADTETTTTTRRYDDGRSETTKTTKSSPHRHTNPVSSLNRYAVHKEDETKGDEHIQTITETWQEGAHKVTKITTKITNTVTQAEETTVKETRGPLLASSDKSAQEVVAGADSKTPLSDKSRSVSQKDAVTEEDSEGDEDEEDEEEEESENEDKKETEKESGAKASLESSKKDEEQKDQSASKTGSARLLQNRDFLAFNDFFPLLSGDWGRDFFLHI